MHAAWACDDADAVEEARVQRLAVAQGEERAQQEVERLERQVVSRPRVRIVDATPPGVNFGLIGVSGVTPPKVNDCAPSDEATEQA